MPKIRKGAYTLNSIYAPFLIFLKIQLVSLHRIYIQFLHLLERSKLMSKNHKLHLQKRMHRYNHIKNIKYLFFQFLKLLILIGFLLVAKLLLQYLHQRAY